MTFPAAPPRAASKSLLRLLPVLRILLGGLFIFSGVAKLLDPRFFASAIQAFHLGFTDGIVLVLAHAIPWTEVLAGAFVLLPSWARAASLVIGTLIALFIAVIASSLARGLDVRCSCFGALDFVCIGDLGVCHIARNLVILALAAFVFRSAPAGFSRAGGNPGIDSRRSA
jgi:uncharacterized membrane protein YphA (DoxX/SURF4 family)